jgi:hypothetical protein
VPRAPRLASHGHVGLTTGCPNVDLRTNPLHSKSPLAAPPSRTRAGPRPAGRRYSPPAVSPLRRYFLRSLARNRSPLRVVCDDNAVHAFLSPRFLEESGNGWRGSILQASAMAIEALGTASWNRGRHALPLARLAVLDRFASALPRSRDLRLFRTDFDRLLPLPPPSSHQPNVRLDCKVRLPSALLCADWRLHGVSKPAGGPNPLDAVWAHLSGSPCCNACDRMPSLSRTAKASDAKRSLAQAACFAPMRSDNVRLLRSRPRDTAGRSEVRRDVARGSTSRSHSHVIAGRNSSKAPMTARHR